LSLQSAVSQASTAPPANFDQASAAASSAASEAHKSVAQIAQGFNLDPQGQVPRIVQNLMDSPIAYAEGLVKTVGSGEINAAARNFCSFARGTLAKYPFNPNSTTQATLEEVTALFKPNTGRLWTFYNEALATAVPKQGNQYVAKPDATVRVSA